MKKNFKIHTKNYFHCIFFLGMACLGICVVLPKSALAQVPKVFNPQQKLSQYILDQWTTRNGLPSNNIRALHKAKNGLLWLGGFDGLTRFDGVKFMTIPKKGVDKFNANMIFRITEGTDSTLWLATHGNGLLTLKNNDFQQRGFANVFINAIWYENPQRIWFSGRETGVFVYNPRTQISQKLDFKVFKDNSIYAIKPDKQGGVWFCTDKRGIVKYQPQSNNQITIYNQAQGLPQESIFNIFFDSQNRIWVCTNVGLYKQQGDRFVFLEEVGKNIIHKVIEDGNQNLWIATSVGLFRRNGLTQKIELFPAQKDQPLTNVLDLLLDEEGSLWIATYRDGLFRLKESKFVNYTIQEGLATTAVGAICQLQDDSYLIGANNGKINQLKGEEISPFPIQAKLPDVRIFHILQDRQANIWIATYDGLLKINPQKQETFYTKDKGLPDNAIRVIHQDQKGNIWGGTRWNGVFRIDMTGKITHYNKKKGLSSNFIMSIQEDVKGNILIGTNDGGLNILTQDNNIKVLNMQNGLLNNLVFNTYADKEGIIWIATNIGISRYDGKNFVNYTQENTALPQENCFDIVEDNLGYFWIPNTKGIIRVAKEELNAFAQKKLKGTINWKIFNKHDGMKSEDCTGAAHSLRAKNGNIWVPTNGGVIKITPANLSTNPIKPKIVLNYVKLNDQVFLPYQQLVFAHSRLRFHFNYSALSYLAPENVKFKYKLENYDEIWTTAGTEREAIYTNLPAGTYTFRVIACNNDGLWNNEGAKISLKITPHFTQTYWFYALLTLLTIGFIVLYIQYRTYRINLKNKELEILVVQRTELLVQQNAEIEYQKQLLAQKNEDVLNSINYAKRIQEATLPTTEKIKTALPQSFIFFKPRDIVSGDFYWFQEIRKRSLLVERSTFEVRAAEVVDFNSASEGAIRQNNPKIIITAIDSTGHGVPGAFMSLIGNDLLNEIINIRNIYEPEKILSLLHKGVQETLKQKETENRDGMDMALCLIEQDISTKDIHLYFAGAKNPLIMIQKVENKDQIPYYLAQLPEGERVKKSVVGNQYILLEIRGDKFSIGGAGTQVHFQQYHLPILLPSWIYLFTDGFQDQFGGASHKKFSRQRLRETLLSMYELPAQEQEQLLEEVLRKWQGGVSQIDDILLIGFLLDKSIDKL